MENKRVLTIQDISCVGQCSITVALPVLSACGAETCILPTAVLSTHTGGFQNPAERNMADMIPDIHAHWKREGITFDAIYTGYLGSAEAVDRILDLMDDLLAPNGVCIVDPAMADNGKLYSGLDQACVDAMMRLCARADILLPNMTEAAMLSGVPYSDRMDQSRVREMLALLRCDRVIMTGVGFNEHETGIYVKSGEEYFHYAHSITPGHYHGTGDIFAACFTGVYIRCRDLIRAGQIAADFTSRCIQETYRSPAHHYGTRFEPILPDLIRLQDSFD